MENFLIPKSIYGEEQIFMKAKETSPYVGCIHVDSKGSKLRNENI